MRQALAAMLCGIALLWLAARPAAAASTTIAASEISASSQVARDLGCEWDRNTSNVTVWALYGSASSQTMELLTPQVLASGSTLVLVFSAADLTMGSTPLASVRVVYGTTAGKC